MSTHPITSSDHPLVRIDRQSRIAVLTLDRAEKRNALNAELMRSLGSAFRSIRDDDSVDVVVLRGDGPLFSSGIDHTFLMEVFNTAQKVPFKHVHYDLQQVFNQIELMEKPVIAALHRACAGMALELALACDFRIATRDCVMGLPELAFGIVPDVGGTTRLVRTVGTSRAKEMILTGKMLKAETALRYGLVTELAEDTADLEHKVTQMAERLAFFPPLSLGMAKSLVQQSADLSHANSLQLEGVVQNVLIRQPELGDRFAGALQFIRERMANPE